MKAFGANCPSGWSGSCSGSFIGAARTGHGKASTRPPARPLCRTTRRERTALFADMTAYLCLARGALDGFTDADIGAAPAYVARHRRVDVGIVGMRIFREQGRRRHDLPRLAVTA